MFEKRNSTVPFQMFSYLLKLQFFLTITERECWYFSNWRKLNSIRMLVFFINVGLSKDSPAFDCKDLKAKVPSATSGVYWIDPDAGSHNNAFQAYCDQQTDGGGWTLVFSYTFTAYSSFSSGANAVTPRPAWRARRAHTRVSTTVPLSETHYEAMNFALWRTIGKEFLIKSNINNWIACKEGSGSLVMQKTGSLSCKLVKQVSKQCPGVVPKSITMDSQGPYLSSSSLYYFFDGHTSGGWPTHDPCGKNQANQVKGVVNPHGNIFMRWKISQTHAEYWGGTEINSSNAVN